MTTLLIEIHFNVVKHFCFQNFPVTQSFAVYQFHLQAVAEAHCTSMVVSVFCAAHAAYYFTVFNYVLVINRKVMPLLFDWICYPAQVSTSHHRHQERIATQLNTLGTDPPQTPARAGYVHGIHQDNDFLRFMILSIASSPTLPTSISMIVVVSNPLPHVPQVQSIYAPAR